MSGDRSEDYYRSIDFTMFKRCAKSKRLFIAVRRINKASLPYIGRAGYKPKLLDCKAKTANCDIVFEGRKYETNGLVVDWEVFGMAVYQAFPDEERPEAKKAWEQFAAGPQRMPLSRYDARGRPAIDHRSGKTGDDPTVVDTSFTYFTQMDRTHKHFGCLRRSPVRQWNSGDYIHGDYDLFAAVAVDDPENKFVREKRLGQEHSRSPHLYDVMNFMNAHCNMPGMINHGEQDTFKDEIDKDPIDVFYPDGETVKAVNGRRSVELLYRREFGGRVMRSAKDEKGEQLRQYWDSKRSRP